MPTKPRHGGTRPNAGRKPGTPNKANSARIAKAEATGVMPLEIVLSNMRRYHERALQLQTAKPKKGEEGEHERAVDEAWEKANAKAISLMEFYHPKLGAVKHEGGGPGSPPVEHRMIVELSDKAKAKALEVLG